MEHRTLVLVAFVNAALTYVLVGAVAPSAAQPRTEIQEVREVGEYAGVTPEGDETPPRHTAARRDTERRVVTWPGFQMRSSGGSRFFIQVTHQIEAQVTSSEGRVEVLLPGMTTHLRNTRRWLETRFFNTPVTRARIERRGDDLVFVFAMRAAVTPQVTQREGQNGYRFLFVDFPAGTYVENPLPAPVAEEDTPAVAPAQQAPGRDDVDIRALEDERPPGM